MFCPDDLEIIKGSPQERRSFFNISISGFNNNYVRYLNEYNKILKTRNEYLKNYEIVNKDYLDVLTNKLIDLIDKLGLRSQLVKVPHDLENILCQEIDYDAVDQVRAVERERAIAYLKKECGEVNGIKTSM